MLASLWYANIHTDHSINGEIRGQLLLVEEAGIPVLPQPGLILFAALLLSTSIWMIQQRLRSRT